MKKIPVGFYGRNLQADAKVYVEIQRALNNQNNFEKKKPKTGGFAPPNFQTYLKLTLSVLHSWDQHG